MKRRLQNQYKTTEILIETFVQSEQLLQHTSEVNLTGQGHDPLSVYLSLSLSSCVFVCLNYLRYLVTERTDNTGVFPCRVVL